MSDRFHIGDRVRTRRERHPGHMRLPQYLCGRVGTIERAHGPVLLADERAYGGARGAVAPREPLYTVLFEGREVWGASLEGPLSITADLWEGYLEPHRETGTR